jgi:hypothetical protein
MNVETLSKIRLFGFAVAGLVCAGYSLAALASNSPDPFAPWLPAVSGVAAAAIIWVSALSAGFAYWFAILLYPIFAVLMALGWVSSPTAFASMGTASGAAPLLAFCFITLRS